LKVAFAVVLEPSADDQMALPRPKFTINFGSAISFYHFSIFIFILVKTLDALVLKDYGLL
jgi:hypothetical protein